MQDWKHPTQLHLRSKLFTSGKHYGGYQETLPFTEKGLDQWLFGDAAEAKTQKSTQSYVNAGPGQLLKWKALASDKHCFVNKDLLQKSAKKKILICNAFLNDRAPKLAELMLMSALTEHYEVHLWQGPEHNLLTDIPLACGNDFWRQRWKIQPATEKTIKTFFASRQMSADQWLILDKTAYEERWGQPRHILNLLEADCSTPAQRNRLLASVDLDAIMTAQIYPSAETIIFLAQNFPNLNRLAIKYMSAQWLQKNIHCFKNTNITHLELIEAIFYSNQFNLSLSTTNSIETLIINFDDNYDSFTDCLDFIVTLPKTAKPIEIITDRLDETGEDDEAITIKTYGPIKKVEQSEEEQNAYVATFQNNFGEVETYGIFNNIGGSIKELLQLTQSGQGHKIIALDINLDILQENFKYLSNLKYLSIIQRGVVTEPLIINSSSLEFLVYEDNYDHQISLEFCPKLFFLGLNLNAAIEASPLPALKILSASISPKKTFTLYPEVENLRIQSLLNEEPSFQLPDTIKTLDFSKGGSFIGFREHPVPEQKNLRIITGRGLRTVKLSDDFYDVNLDLGASQQLRKAEINEKVYLSNIETNQSLTTLTITKGLNPKLGKLPPNCEIRFENFSNYSNFNFTQLDHSQQKLGVSFFSYDSMRSLNIPDGKPGIAHGIGNFQVLLLQGETLIPVNRYRIQRYTKISFSEFGSLCSLFWEVTTPPFSASYKVIQPTLNSTASHNTHSGIFQGNLRLGQAYPLPLLEDVPQAKSFTIYGEFPQGVILGYYYDSNNQEYWVGVLKCPPLIQEVPVKLYYDFTPSINHQTSLSPKPSTPLAVPASMHSPILTALRENKRLHFMFDSKLTLASKLQQLESFCKAFEAKKPLKTWAIPGTLNAFLAIIKERRGTCLVRSQVYTLLANLMGATTALVVNETHAYCEVQTTEGPWQVVDLGGGDLHDHPSVNRSPWQLKSNPIKDSKPSRQGSKKTPESKPVQYPLFSWKLLNNPSAISSTTTSSSSIATKLILIHLSPGTTVDEARRAYFSAKHIPTQCTPYLYIDHPDDFEDYLDPNQMQQGGKSQKIKGPLNEIFESNGTLLINFSNFTHKERNYYQSLWKHNRLHQHTFHQPLTMIFFITEGTQCPPSLTKNCTHYFLPPIPKADIEIKSEQKHSSEILPRVEIDLFEGIDWQEQLLANIFFEDGGSKIVDGPLLTAIQKKQNITIYRPPIDRGFDKLIKQIQIEDRFFFNAQWIAIPAAMQISVASEPSSQLIFSDSPIKFRSHPHEYKESKAEPARIYLNLNNWHTLREDQEYIEIERRDYILRSGPGLIKRVLSAQGPAALFYVTQTLPDCEWERIEAFMRSKCPEQNITFELAPGVTAPGIEALENSKLSEKTITVDQLLSIAAQPTTGSLIFFSNDPDFLTDKLLEVCAKQDPFVIDLMPDMGISDLMLRITPKEKNPFHFNLEELDMLTALKAGQTVILQGQPSFTLLQEFFSLFDKQPHVDINSKRIPIPGRVFFIQPQTPAENLPIPYTYCKVTKEDYRNALLGIKTTASSKREEKEVVVTEILRETKEIKSETPKAEQKEILSNEEIIVDKLLLYFEAAQYPHRGSSMPENIGMNWRRLLQMKKRLQTPLPINHRHNPIKDLMLNDYIKNTEYYAFLNIIAKFLFDDALDDEPMRTKKFEVLLHSVQTKQQNPSDFAWHFLNTCHGSLLRKILGPTWIQDALKIQSEPLFNYWQTKNWEAVFTQLKSTAASSKQIHTVSQSETATNIQKPKKIQERVQYRIDNDDDARIIMLQGDPGVGKTHALDNLKENKAYHSVTSFNQITEWLSPPQDDKLKLFLPDETNTARPGKLNFLNGLYRNHIFYAGKLYRLSKHKVVGTKNHEHFPGRYWHNPLRFCHKELIQLPKRAELEQWLVSTYKLPLALATHAVSAADLYNQLQPHKGYSFRDLQNLMQRYLALCAQRPSDIGTTALYAAIEGEFAITIDSVLLRQQFQNKIKEQLGITQLKDKVESKADRFIAVKGKLFPREMADAKTAIQQALLIRQQVQKRFADKTQVVAAGELAYKRGLLLQSIPGMGKLRLTEALLQEAGLQFAQPETQSINNQRYFIVTAGESSFRKIANQAFKEGAILIAEKLSWISPDEEGFLGKLLMGKNENDEPAKQPGFLMVGLKSSDDEGNTLSPALCSRMHVINLEPPAKTIYKESEESSYHNMSSRHA